MRSPRTIGILVVSTVAVLLPATSSAATWTQQPAAVPLTFNGALSSVSCTGTTCEAVGTNMDTKGNQVPLAEKWTGSAWTLQGAPNPAGGSFNELTAVSCSAADACTALAVGFDAYLFGAATLGAERWDGTKWAVQKITLPSGDFGILTGLSCTSATYCTAVGSYGAQGFPQQRPLVEVWNGKTWTPRTAPVPAGQATAFLKAVSCKFASTCVAVGAAEDAGATKSALGEVWNGKTWTAQILAGASSQLNAISCAAITACTAVGTSSINGGGFAEQLSAGKWTARAIPSTNAMVGVSCSAANACTAVGTPGASIARWNGSTWTAQTAAGGTGAGPASPTLVGISCPAASSCTAVGATGIGFTGATRSSARLRARLLGWKPPAADRNASTPALTYQGGEGYAVAEVWDGSKWTKQAAVNRNGVNSSDTGGISCVSSTTTCMLVGTDLDMKSQLLVPLAEVRSSSGWKIVPVPSPDAIDTGLNGVSCPAANACVAVGVEISGGAAGIYSVWNGTRWTSGRVPAPSGGFNVDLLSVSCHALNSCFAAGFYTDSAGQQDGISESWNGSSWTFHAVPAGPNPSALATVSCASATACAAVGDYQGSSGETALGEIWSGAWLNYYLPVPPGSTQSRLAGVSCVTSSACTAVGNWYSATSNTAGALIDRWNGSSWTLQAGPSQSNLWNLNQVSCATRTACTAVAATAATDWDGTSWTPDSPYAVPADGGAAATDTISCPARLSCLAAGSSVHVLAAQVLLVEAYS